MNTPAPGKWLLLCSSVICATSMAFSQFPTTSYDIYAMNVTTGRIFQISHVSDRGEFDPSWSPNMMYVVHDLVSWSGQDLAITNVATGETVPLIGGEGGNDAAWSPDGQWIAFDNLSSVFVVPAGGGQPLLVAADATSPSWSPNSKRVVFARPSDRSLRTIDVTGTDEKLLLPTLGYDYPMRDPAWSPNGQWIAFEWLGYILKVPVDIHGQVQGDIELVANDYNFNYDPTWSNNSKAIAFGRYPALWVAPASGGEAKQLTTGLVWGDFDAAYSSNSQFLAFARTLAPLSKPAAAQETPMPVDVSLTQNYPNPFNPTTTIRYALPADEYVHLAVYDMLGQKVAQLVDEPVSRGYHDVVFDASRLASGIYICRLEAGSYIHAIRMSLVK